VVKRLLAAFAVGGAVVLGGCGGDDDAPATGAAVAPVATPTTAPAATPAATATPAPIATPTPEPEPTPAATPEPAPTPDAEPVERPRDVALACLERGGLYSPRKRQPKVWGGRDPDSGQDVLVEGPYKTPEQAAGSAESLAEVAIVETGGHFVVTAPLTSGANAPVRTVARCLAQ
jgi:hypothetical protein